MGTFTKMRYAATGCPLPVVVEGLRSRDVDARVAAAGYIRFVRGDDVVGLLSAAMPALTDPVPTVRYHAIRSLAQNAAGREQLLRVLVSTSDSDAPSKNAVLADLARINDPDSPFHGNWKAPNAISYSPVVDGLPAPSNLFNDALRLAESAAASLPILEAAATAKMIPSVYAPADHSYDFARPGSGYQLHTGSWPDRCCVCGTPRPADTEELQFSGAVESHQVGNQVARTIAGGSLRIPVCANAQCHLQARQTPVVGPRGLTVRFASPQFVAELLELGSWQVPAAGGFASVAADKPAPAAPSVQASDWYADPSGRHQLRYWDGSSWSSYVADNGVQSTDPLSPNS